MITSKRATPRVISYTCSECDPPSEEIQSHEETVCDKYSMRGQAYPRSVQVGLGYPARRNRYKSDPASIFF